MPMRYFIAKRVDGPALVVAHRIDAIERWLREAGLSEQFHPTYTRMVPAHYITEIALVGCPDPNPKYVRYFAPRRETLPSDPTRIGGIPLTRHWLIPQALRPKVYVPHPTMSADEIRQRTQRTWDRFYSLRQIWTRSGCVHSLKARLAFVLISKIYRQMYANTGIATDSARVGRSAQWARWMAKPCQRLFAAPPMPHLEAPCVTRFPRPEADSLPITRTGVATPLRLRNLILEQPAHRQEPTRPSR